MITEIRITKQINGEWELTFWDEARIVRQETNYRTVEIALLLAPISLDRINEQEAYSKEPI
jgi:hypothetical protein